jgi:hypothetical protein
MRYAILLALAFTLAFTTRPATAQQQSSGALPSSDHTVVTLGIGGIIATEGEGVPHLPPVILQYLEAQDALVKLNIQILEGLLEGRAQFSAHYMFESMQEYSEWREQDETQAFMRALRDASSENLTFNVGMVKLPAAQLLEDI